jgi:hypothetical protein
MKHSELIEQLGGGTRVAKLLNDELETAAIDRDAVYKWAKLDRIPWKWRPAVMAVARAQGISIPESFLGNETVQ